MFRCDVLPRKPPDLGCKELWVLEVFLPDVMDKSASPRLDVYLCEDLANRWLFQGEDLAALANLMLLLWSDTAVTVDKLQVQSEQPHLITPYLAGFLAE